MAEVIITPITSYWKVSEAEEEKKRIFAKLRKLKTQESKRILLIPLRLKAKADKSRWHPKTGYSQSKRLSQRNFSKTYSNQYIENQQVFLKNRWGDQPKEALSVHHTNQWHRGGLKTLPCY